MKTMDTGLTFKKSSILTFLYFLACSILFLIYSGPAAAENETPSFVDKSGNLLIKPYAGFNFIDFTLQRSDDEGEISYVAKPRAITGISASWEMLGISAGYRWPLSDDEVGQADNEESFDLRLNYYNRYFGCDLYIQQQKGFFLEAPESHNMQRNDDGTLPYFESISLNNYSLNFYYIFSWDTFSLRAAFDGTDIQKKSASSFLLMAGAGELEIESDYSLLLDEAAPAGDRMDGLTYCRYRYISLAPGYGWTAVFCDNYFFNLELFIGMGVQRSTYRSGSGRFSQWSFFPEPDLRFSIGYSSDALIFGFSSTAEMHISPSGDEFETGLLLFDAMFYAGYRFF